MENEKQTLREFMQPRGGMAGLKFMLETAGAKLSSQAVHAFNRQAIPAKYVPAILFIKDKYKIDLMPFVREDKRTLPTVKTDGVIYPALFEKLKGYGLGYVASELNTPDMKAEFLPVNPPKRFNHHSLKKILTQKLHSKTRQFFITNFDAEKEILADEANQESGLLG